MIPELLFSGVSTMQDISRDELTLLPNGCEKESMLVSIEPTLDRLKLEQTPDLEPLTTSIKLESATDAFQWHSNTNANIESNLLGHSEDPLISGALDDHQNDLDTITNCSTLNNSSLSQSQSYSNRKPARTRKVGNQKKFHFHYQDLPRKYLEQYEATQNQSLTKEISILPSNGRTLRKDRSTMIAIPPKSIDVNVNDDHTKAEVKAEKNMPKSRIVSQDLPYMGEITLENFKPRRGRKPKKADICHLIYKNYGTVVAAQQPDEIAATNVDDTVKKSTAQHRIINSLLEKRLTGTKRKAKVEDDGAKVTDDNKTKRVIEEPLNLCVRDRDDCDEDIDEFSDKLRKIKCDLESELLDSNTNITQNLRMALPDFQSAMLDAATQKIPPLSNDITSLNGYEQWSNSSQYINPMALYLQKIVNSSRQYDEQQLNFSSSKPAIDSVCDNSIEKRRLVTPRKIAQLLKDETPQNTQATTSKSDTTRTAIQAMTQPKSNTTTAKRKRSAIFIPPIPEESSTNHATEVSICKFKFTGGAKPSLQEKKMLSVDAGGNFRYYSGTGDKSIRGYEFFPRESLQQSSIGSAPSSNTGAYFLNTPGQKLSNDLPPPSFGLSNELLQIPETGTTSSVGMLSNSSKIITSPITSLSSSSPLIDSNVIQTDHHHDKLDTYNAPKRRSKRSVQREKLEKTFKEKGFLIQTQQLEQAEGTYCKFRQLRKFTRYLFRSWKDYLPGELQQHPNQMPSTSTTHLVTDANANTEQVYFVPSSPASSHDD